MSARRLHSAAARAACSLAVALACCGCGDNWKVSPDGGGGEASPDGGPPPPPALGEMLDRVGRPLTAELLIGTTLPDAERRAAISAYRRAAPDTWPSFEAEILKNLSLFDGLDSAATAGDRCRSNPALAELAELLANDRLFLDTNISLCSEAGCTDYFEVERKALRGSPDHSSCGGLAGTFDAVDVTYTALIKTADPGSGVTPITDGVGRHGDVSTTSFPFLGIAHRSRGAFPPL